MTTTVVRDALDLVAVATWLRSQALDVDEPLEAEVITGGRSNLTFFVADAAGRRWVLRRPPLGSVLATAHDVGREYKVLSALAGTLVPVPRVIGTGADAQGVAFYFMHEEPGLVLRDAAAARPLTHEARSRCGESLAEALAALHAVDPEQVGLGRLGRGDDYVARQITMWQWQAEQHRRTNLPEADAVRDQLLATLPVQAETTLVHGDYRLDNTLVTRVGRVQAVLDWELCTRGDPLADLGIFLYYWTEPADPVQPFPDPATLLPGFCERASLLDHYVRASGRDLNRLPYYLAYAAWRLALVLEGVAGRSASGAYGAPDAAEERRLAEVADGLVVHAAELLRQDSS